ncbi:hypothetical protein ALC60_04920 [Trachymyrmex zeteki]|uniref:Uncharacterized protein n=1 Tax=Mycetomoellerius zeteki TaxID=64791 RepID=A0A151X728_9HYME|nr:hypothetical protein ALC60_04920 [Trachymyrmex zeteki]
MRRDVCRCKQWIALNRGQRPSLLVLRVSALGTSEPRPSFFFRCVTPVRHTEDKQRARRVLHCTAASESVCSCTYCIRLVLLSSHFDSYSFFSNTYHKHTRTC